MIKISKDLNFERTLERAGITESELSIIREKLAILVGSGLPQSEIQKLKEALETNAKFRTAFIENPKVVATIKNDGKLGRTPYVW